MPRTYYVPQVLRGPALKKSLDNFLELPSETQRWVERYDIDQVHLFKLLEDYHPDVEPRNLSFPNATTVVFPPQSWATCLTALEDMLLVTSIGFTIPKMDSSPLTADWINQFRRIFAARADQWESITILFECPECQNITDRLCEDCGQSEAECELAITFNDLLWGIPMPNLTKLSTAGDATIVLDHKLYPKLELLAVEGARPFLRMNPSFNFSTIRCVQLNSVFDAPTDIFDLRRMLGETGCIETPAAVPGYNGSSICDHAPGECPAEGIVATAPGDNHTELDIADEAPELQWERETDDAEGGDTEMSDSSSSSSDSESSDSSSDESEIDTPTRCSIPRGPPPPYRAVARRGERVRVVPVYVPY